MKGKKSPSEQLEEKLVHLTFEAKAKSWDNFDEKKFQRDAQQVNNTFQKEDENISSKRSYF